MANVGLVYPHRTLKRRDAVLYNMLSFNCCIGTWCGKCCEFIRKQSGGITIRKSSRLLQSSTLLIYSLRPVNFSPQRWKAMGWISSPSLHHLRLSHNETLESQPRVGIFSRLNSRSHAPLKYFGAQHSVNSPLDTQIWQAHRATKFGLACNVATYSEVHRAKLTGVGRRERLLEAAHGVIWSSSLEQCPDFRSSGG